MLKLVTKLRIISLIALIITSVPLVITYWAGTEPRNPLITHLHVYIGILFTLLAIANMILMKKDKKNSEKGMPI
ncbi:hypothetical protein [Fidelibacter multiformis]|jgi:hypothetical protein|uniref:hypothetical protein n=1 Tax=Fidelibacter multiformis TaxID=3377529 RepID=UPI0037DCDAA7